MEGAFGDEEEVLKTLEKATPGERHAIAAAYARKYGAPTGSEPEKFLLSRIERDDNFDAEEKQRAGNLLGVGSAQTPEEARRLEAEAAAGRIKVAVDGGGHRRGDDPRDAGRAIQAGDRRHGPVYQASYGHDLRDRLVDECTGGAERAGDPVAVRPGKDGGKAPRPRRRRPPEAGGRRHGHRRGQHPGDPRRQEQAGDRRHRRRLPGRSTGTACATGWSRSPTGPRSRRSCRCSTRGKDGGSDAKVALERDAAR